MPPAVTIPPEPGRPPTMAPPALGMNPPLEGAPPELETEPPDAYDMPPALASGPCPASKLLNL